MSIFTVAECDEHIAVLKARLLADPLGTMGSVSIAGRTVSYRDVDQIKKLVAFWEHQRVAAANTAAGRPRISPKVARFV